jgi:hypothetical protein
LPLLLHDWLSRQRLKDRSGYKPFFGSALGKRWIRRREAKASVIGGKTMDFDFCQVHIR